jgi:hypothetical protein
MLRCRLEGRASDKDGHCGYFLSSTQTSNLGDHFNSFHKDCVSWMDKAFETEKKFKLLQNSATLYLETMDLQNKASSEVILKNCPLTSFFKAEKRVKEVDVSTSGKQELAFLLWLVDAEIAPYAVESKLFGEFKKVANLDLRKCQSLFALIRPTYLMVMQCSRAPVG